MDSRAVFHHLTIDDVAHVLRGARERIIIVAPGINEAIAAALVDGYRRIGRDDVRIILDVDEKNCRSGYGNVDGYSILAEADIPIRASRGQRISFVLADDQGWIFTMPPLMIEAPRDLAGCPNAIKATPEQIRSLIVATEVPSENSQRLADGDPSASYDVPAVPEIGLRYVAKTDIQRIERDIRANPIQDFDLSRVVNVFTAHVQFVELGVEGANIESHTVKLPPELLTVVKDKDTRERLTAAFRLLGENSKISGENLRNATNDVRKRYIRSNPIFGGVILKSKRAALEAEIRNIEALLETHKDNVRERYHREVTKSKKELIQAFWRAVRNSPPDELLAQISRPKPTTEEAKVYLATKLDRIFPDIDQICERMKVNFVTKDVTWDTLNSPNFVDWLARQYPANKDLKTPFDQYRAARQRLAGADQNPNKLGQKDLFA